MAVEEGLDPLGRVGLDEAGIRVRQVEAEEVDLLLDTPITATASPKSTWAWPGGWASGTNTSWVPGMLLAQVIFDDRVAAGKAVLGP